MADEVHLWVFSLTDSYDKNLLSIAESEAAGRFVFEKDRTRYVAAHCALRTVLAGYTGCAPGEIVFGSTENGKPFIDAGRNGTSIHFNLSHSGAFALIGVCQSGPVGVDTEEIRPNVDYANLARSNFSSNETSWLRRQPETEQLRAFYRLWVVKEAFLKAVGAGLSKPLNEVEVDLSRDSDILQDSDWRAEELNVIPNHASAVVMGRGISELKVFRNGEAKR